MQTSLPTLLTLLYMILLVLISCNIVHTYHIDTSIASTDELRLVVRQDEGDDEESHEEEDEEYDDDEEEDEEDDEEDFEDEEDDGLSLIMSTAVVISQTDAERMVEPDAIPCGASIESPTLIKSVHIKPESKVFPLWKSPTRWRFYRPIHLPCS